MSSISVVYANEPRLDVDEFCRVLLESGLGATRPTGNRPRMQQMIDQADLVVTARLDRPDRDELPVGALIGVIEMGRPVEHVDARLILQPCNLTIQIAFGLLPSR